MSMFIGYLTTCIAGPDKGMQYIGIHKCRSAKTQDPWYLGSGPRLRAAKREYGPDAFKRHVMGVFSTRHAARKWESAMTDFMDADNNPGFYNMIPGGGGGAGTPGVPKTEAQKRAISKSLTGKKQSQITKDRRAAAHRGMKRRPITGQRISAALTGKPKSAACKDKMVRARQYPVEHDGVWFPSAEVAAQVRGVGHRTMARWLAEGKNGARRLDNPAMPGYNRHTGIVRAPQRRRMDATGQMAST